MRVYRDIVDTQGNVSTVAVYDIMQATYNAQDMSKRVITANIKNPSTIDFRLGDYVILPMQSLYRDGNHGSVIEEKFYIYTEPIQKKTAKPFSTGDAFDITVNFYPRQYELSCIQMRDFIQQGATDGNIIYTGFDTVSFYGGAHELLERCMACMAREYHDEEGHGLWTYELDPSLNENENNALEKFAFSFNGNSVMEALLKLNDKDFINTTFYINGRTIYVGQKRPFLCAVNASGAITDTPLLMMYGKTSHEPIDIDHGGLYDITKSVGEEVPVTKLFAYGASRNLNRYYCADRIRSGRFVNKLMLPSFSNDGQTDYIISDSANKYGIRENSHTFEEIYPSLRYMTYADIRGIKYCIKIRTSGLSGDIFDSYGRMQHNNSSSVLPLARVQCYKVTPCSGNKTGRNELVECAPPEDLVVFIHATGKTVKVVLYGDDGTPAQDPSVMPRSVERQLEHDPIVPTRDGVADYIPGSCFCVHDVGFMDMNGARYDTNTRDTWFDKDSFLRYKDTDSLKAESLEQQTAELHRIEYVDTFWLTDLYVMGYDERREALYDVQENFSRDGYSAWAWPRLNNESVYPDSLPVNEVVAVEPVVIADTSENASSGRQQHWDIYLRDLGFAIDEQNDFGEMVFVYSTPIVSVLDGMLEGREFTIDGGENMNNFQERVVCAYNEDGSLNPDFLYPGDSGEPGIPQRALNNGAVWRIRLNRNDNDSELSSIGLVLPNIDIKMSAGDHIVLLDIYMPDIYVRAAENRLLREAQWYLEKNDKGNVNYAISFDKVRFNQVRNYAAQMREGVMLRVVDQDLNIKSDNVERTIVSHDIPNRVDVPMYNMTKDVHQDEDVTNRYVYYKDNSTDTPKLSEIARMEGVEGKPGHYKWSLSIPKEPTSRYAYADESVQSTDDSGIAIRMVGHSDIVFDEGTFLITDLGTYYSVQFECENFEVFGHYYRLEDIDLEIEIEEKMSWVDYNKIYLSAGARVPAICRDYVHFKAGKYYEVIVDLQKGYGVDYNYWWQEDDDTIMLTIAPDSDVTRYSILGYAKEKIGEYADGSVMFHRYKYTFFLPDGFSERDGYYVGFHYYAPDNTVANKRDFGAIRMVSVVEKDLDAEGHVVNYVDFIVSSISIKIDDNSRPADTRILGVSPEAIVDISAQIEEQTKATSWGTLMNSIEKTRIEGEQLKKTYEMLTQTARQNSQNLLNLRETLFDPDGTCNDVFLQVMMLQVGADSMNYQLDYTYTTPAGSQSNFSIQGRDSQLGTYDVFRVQDEDHLHHFVYTQGAQTPQGTWTIPGNFAFPLSSETNSEGNTVWPTYYICIRCKRNTNNDLTEQAWICSKKQYAVNDNDPEDPMSSLDYWYFNWGILTADSSGHYSLMETRGNAYMYGDNIVAGKISAIANNAYFDLTHGDFVLSKQGPDSQGKYANGMTYIDNKLTIWGLNDEEGIGKAIKDLQLEEIGADNLYSGLDPVTSLDLIKTDIELANNKSYVISIGRIYGNAYTVDIVDYEGTGTNIQVLKSEIVPLDTSGQQREITDVSVVIKGRGKKLGIRIRSNSTVTFTLERILVQQGTKGTTYSTYYHHLTDALKGSTEAVGGLVMTNLLLLKDTQGQVTAGMSGLQDDGDYTYEGEDYLSQGVAMFGGGTYEDALKQAAGLGAELQRLLPILLTKTGIGSRIGCFEVVDENTVRIRTADGSVEISTDEGITVFNSNGMSCVNISAKTLSASGYEKSYRIAELVNYLVAENDATTYVQMVGNMVGEFTGVVKAGDYICENKPNTVGAAEFRIILELYHWDQRWQKYDAFDEDVKIAYNIYLRNTSNNTKYYINKGEGTGLPSGASIQHYDVASLTSGVVFLTADDEVLLTLTQGSYVIECDIVAYGNNFVQNVRQQAILRTGTPNRLFEKDESSPQVIIGSNGLIASQGAGKALIALSDDNSNYLHIRMLGLPPKGSTPYSNQGDLCVEGDKISIIPQ